MADVKVLIGAEGLPFDKGFGLNASLGFLDIVGHGQVLVGFFHLFILIVRSGVTCSLASEHHIGDSQDHAKPAKQHALKCKEHGKEGPFDVVVPAYQTDRISERLCEVIPVVGDWKRSLDIGHATPVASVPDVLRDVLIGRVADRHVESLSRDEIAYHEDAKCNITGRLVLEIFEYFCDGKDDVDEIHYAEEKVSNLGLVVAVRTENQSTSNDVVCKHLPVVFPSLLDVYNHNLLQPKRKLDQVVPLC